VRTIEKEGAFTSNAKHWRANLQIEEHADRFSALLSGVLLKELDLIEEKGEA